LECTDEGDDEDDEDDEDQFELPKIKNIWECEKIEKCGTKNENEGWICHWCDKDFRVWNATKALCHVTAALKHNMRVCAAKIALPYKAPYQFLLDMRSKKVAVDAQYKDNIDLANKIAGSAKKRKTLDGYFCPKMHQPTLHDCTPP
jgi:hypothetical protein